MHNYRRPSLSKNIAGAFILIVASVLIVFITSCTSGRSSGNQPTPDVNLFISALKTFNLVAQPGSIQNVDVLKLCSEGFLPSCYGNNQGAPYCVFTLPPSLNQNPSQGQAPPIGYDPDNPNNYPANLDFFPTGALYKLTPQEAIVIIGKNPPGCKYFSYIPYIALTENRPGKDYSGIYISGNSTVGFYHRIFGSVCDPVNNFNIRSEKTPNGSAGDPFNSGTVIVVASDKKTCEKVFLSLNKAGYPSSIINQQIIPSGVLRMGLEKGKDNFTLLGRMSMWTDETAGNNYIANLNSYLKIFRITPDSIVAADPYPMPELKPRGSGTTEFELVANLTPDLETLRAGILQQYATSDYTYVEYTTDMAVPDGLVAYTNDTDALADNRDTTYLQTPDFQFNSDDDFAIVYGLNHDVTGKSAYGNIVFYGRELLNGVANLFSPNFPGTANGFFPAEYAGASNYYMYKCARKQSIPGENCLIIPKSTGNPDGKAYGVDNDKNAFITFRSYFEKATGIGPAYSEIVHDRVILFHKK
ncbi:MAG: hypothetical protein V2A78_05640 [bacterium]